MLKRKPFVVPFTRIARALKGRESSLMTSHRPSWRSRLTLTLCCSIAPSTLNELASSSSKMKSRSRTIIPNGVTSIKILSSLWSGQLMARKRCCIFFCSEGPVYREILGESETIDSTLFCKQLEEMEGRVLASHIGRGKILLLDNARSHREKITQQKLKDLEMEWRIHPISRTLSTRFPRISKPGKLLPRTALRECGVRTADVDYIQVLRFLEDSNSQNDGEQSWEHFTIIAGMLTVLILAMKLKFRISVITCAPPR